MSFNAFFRFSGCRNLQGFRPNKIGSFHIFLVQPLPPIPWLSSISLWQIDFEIVWDVVPGHRQRKKSGTLDSEKKTVKINFDMLGCLKEIANTKHQGVEKHQFGYVQQFSCYAPKWLGFHQFIIPLLEHNRFAKPSSNNQSQVFNSFSSFVSFSKTSVLNKDVKFQTLLENQPWRPFLPGFQHNFGFNISSNIDHFVQSLYRCDFH